MKRYACFSGLDYYPGGGWHDFKGSADSLTAARKILFDCKEDWAHIVDMQTGKVVEAHSSQDMDRFHEENLAYMKAMRKLPKN